MQTHIFALGLLVGGSVPAALAAEALVFDQPQFNITSI
jgi:hypothetical protein